MSNLQNSLVNTIKSSAFLLPHTEVPLMRANSMEFAKELKETSDSVLFLANELANWTAEAFNVEDVQMETMDDVVDRYDVIVDLLDNLLEKSDIWMDEMRGTIRKPKKKQWDPSLFDETIQKPQLLFPDKIDNSNDTPFTLKIKEKPHALQPLPSHDEMDKDLQDHLKTLGYIDANTAFVALPHPYQYEIEHLKHPAHLLKPGNPLHRDMQDGYDWIDTVGQLETMLTELSKYPEIAVDTEAHSYRSYQGFICLIQISTRDKDYLVDTLALRGHVHRLNQVFTNPQIIKVMHGAESDIVWFQRDFGVYVVNLFDTYHASHVLELGQHSYAFLLKHYCHVETDKKFQLADWRIRPLTQEMITYARIDTHYLLYIYQVMKQKLLEEDLLKQVLDKSKGTSLKVYTKDFYNATTGLGPGGWRSCLQKYRGTFSALSFSVFKALHQWRDQLAREEDESTHYIMPNSVLYAISERMPDNTKSLLNSCPGTIPPLLKLYANEVLGVIQSTGRAAQQEMESRKKELEQIQVEMHEKERAWKEKFGKARHTRFDDDGNAVMEEGQVAEIEKVEFKSLVKSIAVVKPRLTPLVEGIVEDLSRVEELKRELFQTIMEVVESEDVEEEVGEERVDVGEEVEDNVDENVQEEETVQEGLRTETMEIDQDSVEVIQVGKSKKRRRGKRGTGSGNITPTQDFDYSTATSSVKDSFAKMEKKLAKSKQVQEKFDRNEMKFVMQGGQEVELEGDEIYHEKKRVKTTEKPLDKQKSSLKEARLTNAPKSGNKVIR